MIKFLIVEYCVCRIDVCLSQGNFLCFLQGNVGRRLSVLGIGRIVIIVVNGYDAGRKVQPFHSLLRTGAHIRQKIIAGKHRAGFKLQDNVLFVSVDVIHKITRLVDLNNQILQDVLTAFADIVRINLHNAFSIVVPAGQGSHFAILVVFNLDFRIDANGESTRLLQCGSLLRRRSARGQKDCNRYSQGRYRCKKFSSRFHADCSFRIVFELSFVLPHIHRLRGRIQKTGVSWKIFSEISRHHRHRHDCHHYHRRCSRCRRRHLHRRQCHYPGHNRYSRPCNR